MVRGHRDCKVITSQRADAALPTTVGRAGATTTKSGLPFEPLDHHRALSDGTRASGSANPSMEIICKAFGARKPGLHNRDRAARVSVSANAVSTASAEAQLPDR